MPLSTSRPGPGLGLRICWPPGRIFKLRPGRDLKAPPPDRLWPPVSRAYCAVAPDALLADAAELLTCLQSMRCGLSIPGVFFVPMLACDGGLPP